MIPRSRSPASTELKLAATRSCFPNLRTAGPALTLPPISINFPAGNNLRYQEAGANRQKEDAASSFSTRSFDRAVMSRPSRAAEACRRASEQNRKDLINQQRTNGAEDTVLTRRPKSSKVCTLQLDISRRWSLARAARAGP